MTTGTLPNGLRYYIRRNGRPEQRVVMQLAVKAGSIDEENDQQGLAHFLEHMAFNGTRHFKAGELIATLESTGARMGPHVNAYTSFDETVYQFELPTNREGVVEKGLQALADFAGGMLLTPAEIDKERGVVIEEWRGGLGAGSRLRDQQIPVLYYQSKYAERLPIGKPEILKSFTPDRLKAFYTKWYRPDRMAVVVVGDVDPPKMEAMIRTEFGPLVKPAAAAPPRTYPVPLPSEVLYKVATDPEATQSSVSIVQKRAREPQDRVGDYRRSLVNQLVFQMLNDRFDELSRKPDAPFLSAGSSRQRTDADGRNGVARRRCAGRQDRSRPCRACHRGEAGRSSTGSAPRSSIARRSGRSPATTARTPSATRPRAARYVQEYVNHFLEGEPSPGIAYEHQLAHAVIPAIALTDVNAAAKVAVFALRAASILAVSPQKANVAVPTDVQLKAALAATDSVAVTAWNDTAMGTTLMEHVPEPAAVTSRREIPELGVTVVQFANGVEAWFKPTDFKNDQVLFSLAGIGGTSLADPDKYPEAQLATSLVGLSGVGGHSAIELQKLLRRQDRRGLAVLHAVDAGHLGVEHAREPRDRAAAAEPELHRAGRRSRGVRPDQAPARSGVRQPRQQSERASSAKSSRPMNTMNHYTARPLTLGTDRHARSRRDGVVLSRAVRERCATTRSSWSAPSRSTRRCRWSRATSARCRRPAPREQVQGRRHHVPGIRSRRPSSRRGASRRATTVLSFAADPPLEENEQGRVEAATTVLEIALRDILREELGETYSVSVGLSQRLPQSTGGSIGVSFGSAPENVDAMVERVLQEVPPAAG